MECSSDRMLKCPSPSCASRNICCDFSYKENLMKAQVRCKTCGTSGQLINITFSDLGLAWKEADLYIQQMKEHTINSAICEWNSISRYVEGLKFDIVHGWNEAQLSEAVLQLLSILQHKKEK